ncbi:hypothetical protein D3C76_1587040 [compost metagenome]
MAFGQQATGRVGHHLTAIAVVTIKDEALSPADRAQPQGLISEQFVVGETVMQLDHTNVLRVNTGLLVNRFGRPLRHIEADHFDHRPRLMANRRISGQ